MSKTPEKLNLQYRPQVRACAVIIIYHKFLKGAEK